MYGHSYKSCFSALSLALFALLYAFAGRPSQRYVCVDLPFCGDAGLASFVSGNDSQRSDFTAGELPKQSEDDRQRAKKRIKTRRTFIVFENVILVKTAFIVPAPLMHSGALDWRPDSAEGILSRAGLVRVYQKHRNQALL